MNKQLTLFNTKKYKTVKLYDERLIDTWMLEIDLAIAQADKAGDQHRKSGLIVHKLFIGSFT